MQSARSGIGRLVLAAFLAPVVAPLCISLLLRTNPFDMFWVDMYALGIAWLAALFCGIPLYILLQRRGIANWWTAGLMGLVGLALVPLWMGLLFLIQHGPTPLPRLRDVAETYDALLTSGLFLLAAPSAILTGLLFHGLVRGAGVLSGALSRV